MDSFFFSYGKEKPMIEAMFMFHGHAIAMHPSHSVTGNRDTRRNTEVVEYMATCMYYDYYFYSMAH